MKKYQRTGVGAERERIRHTVQRRASWDSNWALACLTRLNLRNMVVFRHKT